MSQTATVQTELTVCQADREKYHDELTDSQTEVNKRDTTIADLKVEISNLTISNGECNNSLDDLRCRINHFLPKVEEIETKVKDTLDDAVTMLDEAKELNVDFATNNNIECAECGPDAPCFRHAPAAIAV